MNKIFCILTLAFLIASCHDKFPEFKKVEEGIFIKLLSFDNDGKAYKKNCYVGANLTMKASDSLIYYRYKAFPFKSTKSNFDKIFNYLNEGDSAVFNISKKMLKNNSLHIDFSKFDADFIEIDVKINHYYSQQEYNNYLSNNDFELIEQSLLKNYLAANKIDSSFFINGIYKIVEKEGKGELVKKGEQIKIKYTGFFINNLKFDETPKNQFLEFNLGTPNQVIKGIEIALKTMKKGEKSKIIITSQLAFGEEGSSTGIVPPYTTVIYNLEILND